MSHPFYVSTLWSGLIQNCTLARVVLASADESIVYALNVSKKFDGSNYKLPIAIPLVEAMHRVEARACERVNECLRTAEMLKADFELKEEQIVERDIRNELIAPLLNASVLEELLKNGIKATSLRERAEAVSKTPQFLLRLLTRRWTFGCDQNAMLHHRSLRGAPGLERLDQKRKPGRKGALEKVAANPELKEELQASLPLGQKIEVYPRGLRKTDVAIFVSALLEYYVRDGKSLTTTYRLMRENRYYQRTRLAGNSVTQQFQINPARVPTENQFLRKARQIIKEMGLKRGHVGQFEYDREHRPITGNSSDMSCFPGDVLDMDVFHCKWEITNDDLYGFPIGYPSVVLCVDRASQAILGFHDYIGPGESAEVYKMGLFWSMTGPAAHVESLKLADSIEGLSYAKQQTYGTPVRLLVDRGPANSRIFHEAIVKNLRIGIHPQPPQWPMGKVVESIIGAVEVRMSGEKGAYTRHQNHRKRERAKAARNNAIASRTDFRKHLLAVINEWNLFQDARVLLTSEMRGVLPNPASIFDWGRRNYFGDRVHQYSHQELFVQLLNHETRVARRDGVHFDSMIFTSSAYERWLSSAFGSGTRTVTFAYHTSSPSTIIWLRDGEFEIMYATKQTARRYDGMSPEEIQRDSLIRSAQVQLQDREKSKARMVSGSSTRIMEKNKGRQVAKNVPPGLVQDARRAERFKDINEMGKRFREATGETGSPPSSTSQSGASEPYTPEEEIALKEFERIFGGGLGYGEKG